MRAPTRPYFDWRGDVAKRITTVAAVRLADCPARPRVMARPSRARQGALASSTGPGVDRSFTGDSRAIALWRRVTRV